MKAGWEMLDRHMLNEVVNVKSCPWNKMTNQSKKYTQMQVHIENLNNRCTLKKLEMPTFPN